MVSEPRPIFLEEIRLTSSNVSDRVRTTSVAVIASAWAFIFGGGIAEFSDPILVRLLSASVVFAAFAMAADFFQYLCGYLSAVSDFGEIKRPDGLFNDKRISYRLRSLFFKLKCFCCAISCILLLGTLIFGGLTYEIS